MEYQTMIVWNDTSSLDQDVYIQPSSTLNINPQTAKIVDITYKTDIDSENTILVKKNISIPSNQYIK